jgi:hypothetical protein
MTDPLETPHFVAQVLADLYGDGIDGIPGDVIKDAAAAVYGNTPLPTSAADARATGSPVYVARRRRTRADMAAIRKAILDILSKDHPQTVRQVFYALTVRGVIAKAEIEYQRTVCRLLTEMREAGQIPFEWIADNTRWQRKPSTFVGLESCLDSVAKFYRRDLWAAMPVYVEVWCEKDALAGVLLEETKIYDVPLMVSRGYSSLSFLHSAAMAIKAKGKPAFVYHFGDLDPSGVDAARDIEAKLRRYAPGAEIHFERPAVTREQVEQWNLPTRPTKMKDTRAKKFGSPTSVELDAIPAHKLRDIARECIERHVDKQKFELLRIAEESERELLKKWSATLRGAIT